MLSEFFTKHGERLKLKIVFVSSDKDLASFKAYFAHMSFGLALPFGDAHKEVCGKDVRGIPTLKLFKRDGTLVTGDARGHVTSDAAGARFPWA